MTSFIAGIFDIVVGSAMLLFFTRFMLQFADIDATHPFGKIVYGWTRIVDVFGRIFPTLGAGKINTAALALMFLLRLIFMWGVLGMLKVDSQYIGLFHMTELNLDMLDHLHRYFSPYMLFFVALITLVIDFLRMCQYLIIASFMISWVVFFTQKLHPGLALLGQLSEPIIAPFRKIIPSMGMFDLAPMIGYFIILLLEAVVTALAAYLLTL